MKRPVWRDSTLGQGRRCYLVAAFARTAVGVCRASAGAPGVVAAFAGLQRGLAMLEQVQIDLTARLDERTGELRAAREANRELTRALNQRHGDQP